MKAYANIYRAARMKAAQDEPTFSSRDRAAAALYVSTEALQDYETGKTLPPCDVVQRMVEIYGAEDLKRQHIRECCPLLPDYGGERPCKLSRAALGWAVEVHNMKALARRFASLAMDGEISAEELDAARAVRDKAVKLRQVMEESNAALDKALRAVRE